MNQDLGQPFIAIDEDTKSVLLSAGKWGKFIAGFGIFISFFIVMSGVWVSTTFETYYTIGLISFFAFIAFLAALYIIPSIFLWRFGK